MSGVVETTEPTARLDRDELVRGWRDYEAVMPRVVPVLKFAAKTDMGRVRENNEDKFDFYEPDEPEILAARGSLYVVADGIGGALAGQIASEMMVKRLISGYYGSSAPDPDDALRCAISETNDRIYHLAQLIPERTGMGTTLTAAIFLQDDVIVAQVGDSRAYLIRDGELRQVTTDHSWVEEQVRSGALSRMDAEASPYRNVITRSVGAGPTVAPDIFHETCRVGDVWVLCSDGLTGHVGEDEIVRVASAHGPSEAARQLIELANSRGGRDNITVFVLSVRGIEACEGSPAVHEQVVSRPPMSADLAERAPQSDGASASAAEPAPDRGGWRRIFGR